MGGDEGRAVRKKVAECLRMVLAGKVSCDHLIEEFVVIDDPEVRAVVAAIEKEAHEGGRYTKLADRKQEFTREINRLLHRLESS